MFNLQPSNLQPSNLQPSNLQPSNLQPSNFQPSNLGQKATLREQLVTYSHPNMGIATKFINKLTRITPTIFKTNPTLTMVDIGKYS
ncbi:MAG: hypothetical protein F6K55_20220 [Moorea sp. SIO4A3]|nr:hypothetical protein [Moorena sp. SIO4A3]